MEFTLFPQAAVLTVAGIFYDRYSKGTG